MNEPCYCNKNVIKLVHVLNPSVYMNQYHMSNFQKDKKISVVESTALSQTEQLIVHPKSYLFYFPVTSQYIRHNEISCPELWPLSTTNDTSNTIVAESTPESIVLLVNKGPLTGQDL